MRKQLVALAVAGTAAAGLFAAPAAHAADTSTTFTLEATGDLSISVPDSTELSAGTATTAGTLTAQLGAVTVTDERGELLAAWTASVSSSDFTTGTATANETIAKANVSYASGVATATTGLGVFTPGQATTLLAQALSASRTAFAGTALVGNNSASWNPTVVITIPSSAVVGEYSGTITHSLA
jgi:hypothetical protein